MEKALRDRAEAGVDRLSGDAARKEATARDERLATLIRSHLEKHLALDASGLEFNGTALVEAAWRDLNVRWVTSGYDKFWAEVEAKGTPRLAAALSAWALRWRQWLDQDELARIAHAGLLRLNVTVSDRLSADVAGQASQVIDELSTVAGRVLWHLDQAVGITNRTLALVLKTPAAVVTAQGSV